ncbi:MAG: SCP2 sterol-binding domain-containing protein [Acidimicrobiales bacterium]|nr:SCP2 sterol-binding domain-containing protein [Acidimicrobiales bacterium]
MSKFLSEEWAADVSRVLNEHDGWKNAIGTASLGIQFETEDGPDGAVDYYLSAENGQTTMALGRLESPDVTVKQSYDTATAISKGEMNTQMAFMTGKIKVSGNLAKLMQHQAAIAQWSSAIGSLDVEY